MKPTDITAPSQTEALTLAFDLAHPPSKVWRALTDPVLLSEWLQPIVELKLEPGAAFVFQTPAHPGWDGIVHCRVLEVEAPKKDQLHVGGHRPRHRRHLHPHAHAVRHPLAPRAVGLQA
jgi:hypothetical protein